MGALHISIGFPVTMRAMTSPKQREGEKGRVRVTMRGIDSGCESESIGRGTGFGSDGESESESESDRLGTSHGTRVLSTRVCTYMVLEFKEIKYCVVYKFNYLSFQTLSSRWHFIFTKIQLIHYDVGRDPLDRLNQRFNLMIG